MPLVLRSSGLKTGVTQLAVDAANDVARHSWTTANTLACASGWYFHGFRKLKKLVRPVIFYGSVDMSDIFPFETCPRQTWTMAPKNVSCNAKPAMRRAAMLWVRWSSGQVPKQWQRKDYLLHGKSVF